ncbi:MAG: hypothetical protein J0M12_10190 [Deltaproteobacteria bacterium]|nr:hypothetical protein [Deltaproteobacteria bacterium]
MAANIVTAPIHSEKAPRIYSALFWLSIFALSTLGVLPWIQVSYLHVDHAETIYHAREVLAGRVPYRDIFTHHFFGYILPVSLAGIIFPLDEVALKILVVLYKFLSAALLYLAARILFDNRTGCIAAFLFVTIGWFYSWQGNLLNVQGCIEPVLCGYLALLAAACTTPSRARLCGAAFACSLLFVYDQRMVVFGLLLAIPLRIHKGYHSPIALAQVALIFLVLPCFSVLFLWHLGAFQDFIEQTLLFPLFSRNHEVDLSARWFDLASYFVRSEPVVICLTIIGVLGLPQEKKHGASGLIIILGTILGFAYAMIGGRNYTNYYLPMAPFLILGISAIWASPAYTPDSIGGRLLRRSAIAYAIFAAILPFLISASGMKLYFSGDERMSAGVAAFLKPKLSPQDEVLVWGYKPQIYLLLDRFSPFRDMGLLSVGGADFSNENGQNQAYDMTLLKEFQHLLSETPPRYIVEVRKKDIECAHAYCFGRGEVQKNMDFRNVEYLRFLRERIAAHYKPLIEVNSSVESAIIYEEQK